MRQCGLRFSFVSVIGLCLTPACVTNAALLQLDVNSISVTASDEAGGGAFNQATGTGKLSLLLNDDSFLNDVVIGNDSQTFDGTLTALAGVVHIVAGSVVSGNATITVQNPDASTNTLSFILSPDGGTDLTGTTDAFLSADLANAAFTSSSFADVDVSPWRPAPKGGSILLSFFNLGGAQPTPDAGIDIFIDSSFVSPEPTGIALGAAGFMLLAGRRRK